MISLSQKSKEAKIIVPSITISFKYRFSKNLNFSSGILRFLLVAYLISVGCSCASRQTYIQRSYYITKETPIYAIGFSGDFLVIKTSNGDYYNNWQPEVASLTMKSGLRPYETRDTPCSQCMYYTTNTRVESHGSYNKVTFQLNKIYLDDTEYNLLQKAFSSELKEEVTYLQLLIDAYNKRYGPPVMRGSELFLRD